MLGWIKDSKVGIAFHSCFDFAKQLLITTAAVKQLLPCHQAVAWQARKLLGLLFSCLASSLRPFSAHEILTDFRKRRS